MQIKTALLFYDPKQLSPQLALTYLKAVHQAIGEIDSKTINFFSSKFDDLALVSHHRVVALPTFLLLNEKNKVVLRSTTDLPSPESLTGLNEEA